MSCITEILKLKGDNEVFVPLNNPDKEPWIIVEGGGIYKDYEYLVVVNHHGHRCGYVAIPTGHKYDLTPLESVEFLGRIHERYDYDKLNINCHGGLTFMSRDHDLKDLLKKPCTDFWIGFDCGHLGDAPDIKMVKKYFGEEYFKSMESFFKTLSSSIFNDGRKVPVRKFDYVEKQCKSIVEQLIKVQESI